MNQSSTLSVKGEFTIFRAQELKSILLAAPQPLVIDLSGVTDIDTAGVQLLMLAKRMAVAAQHELHLIAHSQAVIEVFELLNVVAYFGDPLVMDARANDVAKEPANGVTARNSNES
jgi:anti-sigma B factor antagonist